MRVQSYLVAARLTQSTDMVWTLPDVLATALPLRTLPLPFDVPPMDWNLYWPRSAQDDPASLWMRGQLESAVARLLSGD